MVAKGKGMVFDFDKCSLSKMNENIVSSIHRVLLYSK